MSVASVTKHKLTIAEYYKLGESLPPKARVELIEGELYDMAPIGSEHADIVDFLGDLLRYAVPRDFVVRRQNPVRLGAHSEPQPDICVVKPRAIPYSKAHPGPEDVLLIVEVSDQTLTHDRETKLPLYARHVIPEAWIVNLKDHQLEVHRTPKNGIYQKVSHLADTSEVILTLMPTVSIRIADIFSRL